MRPSSLLLAAALVAGSALPAAAGPFTGHFNDLLTELNARDAALPETGLTPQQRRERVALRKCFAALRADSKDLGGDLRMARRMAKALEKGYPEDPTFASLLAGLNDALRGDVGVARDDLAVAISLAGEGTLRDRAQAKLDGADVLLSEADAEPVASLRAATHRRALTRLDQGARLAARAGPGGPTGTSDMGATVDGSPWQVNSDFGTAVSGISYVSDSTGGLRKVIVAGRYVEPVPNGNKPPLPGDETRLQITIAANTTDVATGTYDVSVRNDYSTTAQWTFDPVSGASSTAIAVSGTVTITSLTVRLGSVDVAGTFSLTMYDGVADDSFEITGGTFEAYDLPRSSVP